MLNLKDGNKLIKILLFCALSFVGGAINGFVGTGGGILYVFMLNLLTKNDKRDNFSTTLLAIIPLSIVGLFAYYKAGSVDFSALNDSLIPGILGGFSGAFLTDKLNLKWLNILFGGLIIYSGIKMIL